MSAPTNGRVSTGELKTMSSASIALISFGLCAPDSLSALNGCIFGLPSVGLKARLLPRDAWIARPQKIAGSTHAVNPFRHLSVRCKAIFLRAHQAGINFFPGDKQCPLTYASPEKSDGAPGLHAVAGCVENASRAVISATSTTQLPSGERASDARTTAADPAAETLK